MPSYTGPATPSSRAGAPMWLFWLPVQSSFFTSPNLPLNLSEMILLSCNRQKSNEGNKMKKKKKLKQRGKDGRDREVTGITGGTFCLPHPSLSFSVSA